MVRVAESFGMALIESSRSPDAIRQMRRPPADHGARQANGYAGMLRKIQNRMTMASNNPAPSGFAQKAQEAGSSSTRVRRHRCTAPTAGNSRNTSGFIRNAV